VGRFDVIYVRVDMAIRDALSGDKIKPISP